VDEEAVFSSSEDRIRASVASVGVAERPVVLKQSSSRNRLPALAPEKQAGFADRLAQSLFSVLFPSDCRICRAPLLDISRLPVCAECLASIVPIGGPICSICGERVLSSYAVADEDGLLCCPVCRRVRRPFARAVAYGSYDVALRELVHLLKYNRVRPAAAILGRMLAEAITTLQPAFTDNSVLLVPVPLYKGKRHQRGFNQVELIARHALKLLETSALELRPDILARTRDTHSQIGLTSHQRRENLRGAFAVASAPEVTGREILLVDDVYTTGTTVTECAKVLRRAGAAQVWVATVARTLKLASKYVEIAPEDAEANAVATAVGS
jgi:ComF family protein